MVEAQPLCNRNPMISRVRFCFAKSGSRSQKDREIAVPFAVLFLQNEMLLDVLKFGSVIENTWG